MRVCACEERDRWMIFYLLNSVYYACQTANSRNLYKENFSNLQGNTRNAYYLLNKNGAFNSNRLLHDKTFNAIK